MDILDSHNIFLPWFEKYVDNTRTPPPTYKVEGRCPYNNGHSIRSRFAPDQYQLILKTFHSLGLVGIERLPGHIINEQLQNPDNHFSSSINSAFLSTFNEFMSQSPEAAPVLFATIISTAATEGLRMLINDTCMFASGNSGEDLFYPDRRFVSIPGRSNILNIEVHCLGKWLARRWSDSLVEGTLGLQRSGYSFSKNTYPNPSLKTLGPTVKSSFLRLSRDSAKIGLEPFGVDTGVYDRCFDIVVYNALNDVIPD